MTCRRLAPLLLAMAALPALTGRAAETEGVHCSVVYDQDGDEVILMESEWISMHLLPRLQAVINRFVFRPTGNDIVEALAPKIRMLGGGILMDCLWEQDWRFQELKEKPYPYQITRTGPDEAQVVFETDLTGWVGSDNSGVISKLLSNLLLRRTVTLKSGQPFFRFDFEFVVQDQQAKRPTFWAHNSSVVDTVGMESVLRPSARGGLEIRGVYRGEPVVNSDHYVLDFNKGWSARIARNRKEGIVYLMDYDYVEMLYNNSNGTVEWMYDGILALRDRPWRGRVYILPIIGLSGVDYANEYYICEVRARREEGRLKIDYYLTSSYEKAARVTLNTEVEYNLLPESGETAAARLEPVVVDGLGIQPARGHVEVELDAPDPLVFNVSTFVELPDATLKKFDFQVYYPGEYDSGQGQNTRRDGKPVRLLDHPVRRPEVPPVPAGLAIRRDELAVFGVLGLGSERMGIRQAVEEQLGGARFEIGYCSGRDAYGYALGDFPYDYDRLFGFRVLLLANAHLKEIRSVGASVLMPWLESGGGLVYSGGENAFTFELREHPINDFDPVVPTPNNLRRDPRQLQAPLAPDHPIFRGVDLSDLPWLLYCHDVQVKNLPGVRVLMNVGEYPFIVENRTEHQVTLAVLCNHFGTEEELGHRHLRNWPEWPKLYANIVRYAAGDLK